MTKKKLNILAQAMKKVAMTTVMQNAELAEAVTAELEELKQDDINPLKDFTGMPDTGDYEYVDLGLPSGLLWAKCNVGAAQETDYGLYFAWGETEGYPNARGEKKFYWNDYKFGKYMTKYNTTDGKTMLDPEDDAAHVHMGGSWRMPTAAEFRELFENTDHEFTTINGVNGRKFMRRDNHDVYIFIPAAGYCYNGNRVNSTWGFCGWSSSLYESSVSGAWNMYFSSGGINMSNSNRCSGMSVRGVSGANSSSLKTSKADKVKNATNGNFPTLDVTGNLQDSGKSPDDFYWKKKDILIEEDGIFQIKDNSVYPVAHPDLSTQASILPQRFGNLDIREVLIAKGRENEIPLDAMVMEAWSFNSAECIAAVCKKDAKGWQITNPANIVPDFTLIKYVGPDLGYYYAPQTEDTYYEGCIVDLVDLGLPSGRLWNRYNVGAQAESDYGLYFAWGDTKGYPNAKKKKFTIDDYKYGPIDWGASPNFGITKYNNTDGKTTLDPEDDAAYQATAGQLRMPTKADWEELFRNTVQEPDNIKGVMGRRFMRIDNNDVYIFIPHAGYCSNGKRYNAVYTADSWSSLRLESSVDSAWYLRFSNDGIGTSDYIRCSGMSVRGVSV